MKNRSAGDEKSQRGRRAGNYSFGSWPDVSRAISIRDVDNPWWNFSKIDFLNKQIEWELINNT